MGPGSDQIEVLIPHLDGRERLRSTLDALGAQTHVPAVCVVDNGSREGACEMIAADFPHVRLLELGENHGFGAAVNIAARSSRARLLVLLNDDAEPDAHFIERIESRQRETGAEMVAACLRSPGGAVESMGVEIDSALNAYDTCYGLPYSPSLNPQPLGPSGGAAAYLREAFSSVGGFDENIFVYLEDVDLAVRMRLQGMACATAPGAFAWHQHSATAGARSSRKNELLAFSRGYLVWKYGRSIPRSERLQGLAIDLGVMGGKALIDRNLGAFKGRFRARRFLRDRERPGPRAGFEELPLLRLGMREALSRRLGRRR